MEHYDVAPVEGMHPELGLLVATWRDSSREWRSNLDDVPDEWKDYTKANVDFFNELGSPGGASKVGKVSADPEFIKVLEPQAEGH